MLKKISISLIIIVSTQLHGFDWLMDRLPELNLTGWESEDSADTHHAMNSHINSLPFLQPPAIQQNNVMVNLSESLTNNNESDSFSSMLPEYPAHLSVHTNQILQFVQRHKKFTTALGLALLAGMTGSAPVWYMAATSAITCPVASLLENISQTTLQPLMNSATTLTSVATGRPNPTNNSVNIRNISPMRRIRPSSPMYHNRTDETEFNFESLDSKDKGPTPQKKSVDLGQVLNITKEARATVDSLTKTLDTATHTMTHGVLPIIQATHQPDNRTPEQIVQDDTRKALSRTAEHTKFTDIQNIVNAGGNAVTNLTNALHAATPMIQRIFPEDLRTPEEKAQDKESKQRNLEAHRKSLKRMFGKIEKTSANVTKTTEHMSTITKTLGNIFAPRRYEKLVSRTGSTFVQTLGCTAFMGIGGAILYRNLLNHIDNRSTLFASIGGSMIAGSMLYARFGMQAPAYHVKSKTNIEEPKITLPVHIKEEEIEEPGAGAFASSDLG